MAIFLIRKSRCAEVARELLRVAFAGILVSDRWSAYAWVDVARRQLFWAHLFYMTAACEAALHGTSLPSLLPA